MEKALHDYFYVVKDGKKPVLYDRRYTPYLIDGANNHIKQLEGRGSIQIAHDEFLYKCMDEYLRNGASATLLNNLNINLAHIRHQCHVENLNKKIQAIYVAHLPHKPHPTMFAAYMFSNMTSLGWLDGLKRCKSSECLQFFIGRSNVKWCSKTCGSRSRVKKMRKKNKSSYF